MEEISVEAVRASAGPIATAPDRAAGSGGPSGVTGYVARISPTATKTDTPLIETPQAVTVVTREQLNDRNVQSVSQALEVVPGVTTNVQGFDPRVDAFLIRGFVGTYDSVYRDGLRQSAIALTVPQVEPYGLEALTVLRGPAAGLYGLGSPGGIVDLTTKRPVFQPFGELWLQGGTFDRVQGNVDVGGPVEGSDGTMAYRLTGVVRQSGTPLPGTSDDRVYIAPAFTWRPSADTTLTLLSGFQSSRVPGTAAFANLPGFRVSRLYQGDAGSNTLAQQHYRIGYAFEHRFAPGLILRQNARYQDLASDGQLTLFTGFDGITARRTGLRLHAGLSSFAVDTQLEGRFATGPVGHTLIGGIDTLRSDGSRRFGFTTLPDLDLTGVTDFARYRSRTLLPRPPLGAAIDQSQEQVGVYLQEQARWERFVLTLTGRHDWVTQRVAIPTGPGPFSGSSQDDSAFSSRVGLNYLLTPGLVPYASYATTFTPQFGADAQGRLFKPSRGDQIEAGVKLAIPQAGLTGAIAGFDIVQSSILQPNPLDITQQVATGRVESKGFEAELTAHVAPGTNVTLAFTHLDIRFLRQTSPVTGSPLDGNALSGIPGNTIAAFGTYQFPPGSWLAGLQIGGGVRYTGTSFADVENTVRNPTVTVFDALVAYDFAALDPRYRGFRAQVNAYNVFDRASTTCEVGFCYRGAPATVIGSLIYRW